MQGRGQLLRKPQVTTDASAHPVRAPTPWHPDVVGESMSFMTSAVRAELAEVMLVSAWYRRGGGPSYV